MEMRTPDNVSWTNRCGTYLQYGALMSAGYRELDRGVAFV